jgi:predicted amidophosphoribosyltransferase
MLIDILLPAPCVVCGKLPKPICTPCVPELEVQEEKIFGIPLFFAGRLDGDLEKVITSYKDSHRISVEPVLVGLLNQVVRQTQTRVAFDLFAIPPRNKKNFRRRGFHPIERLTARSHLGNIPRVYSSATRPVSDQRLLAAKERAGNTNQAFSLCRGQGDLVLVDDVLTTGATVAELGRAAIEAGYRVSAICVIARR